MVRFAFCISILMGLSACGKEKFPNYAEQDPHLQHEEAEGFYKANFFPINQGVSRKVMATGILWTKGKQFYVKIMMEGAHNVRYQQYIHRGSFCPGPEHDANRDNVVDMLEAISASGEMLIPLDGNLKSQEHGSDRFPTTDKEGKYYYSQATSIFKMMNDLHLKDLAPHDSLGKLKRDEKLEIDRRVVILYGTPFDPLLPVACAEIEEEVLHRD